MAHDVYVMINMDWSCVSLFVSILKTKTTTKNKTDMDVLPEGPGDRQPL